MDLQEYLANTGESQAAFARRVGVSQGMVWQWIARRRPVAILQCVKIEAATGGAVKRELLRPDVDWPAVRGSLGQEAA